LLTATTTGTRWEAPAIKAWGKIDGGGNTLGGSGIASVTSNAGDYTVNFLTPMPSANYTIQLTVQGDYKIWVESQTTDNCTIRIVDDSGVAGSAVFFITIID
ncbi:MAG: hypothetical protein P8Z38_12685, partial [Robiginitalea sp.]